MEIIYIEEITSINSELILPILGERVKLHYIVGKNNKIPEAKYEGLYFMKYPRFALDNSFAILPIIKRIMKERNIDIIQSHFSLSWLLNVNIPVFEYNGGLWLRAWLARYIYEKDIVKRIKMIRGLIHLVIPEYISTKKADRIFAVSDSVKNELEKYYKISPIKCFNLLIQRPREEFYRIFLNKTENDRPHLIYFGRLDPIKGIRQFVEVFVKSKFLNIDFTIIGNGPELLKIKRLVQHDTRINLIEKMISHAELINIISKTNIFILPSFYEGMSRALLEAMASGHACIINSELNKKEGSIKRSCLEAYDFSDMIIKIDKLSRDKTLRFSYQSIAHEEALSFYDANEIVNYMIQCYKSYLGI